MLLPNLRDSLLKLADAACLVGLDGVDAFNELNQNRVVLCQRVGEACQQKLSHSPNVVAHRYCHGNRCPEVFDCLRIHSSPQQVLFPHLLHSGRVRLFERLAFSHHLPHQRHMLARVMLRMSAKCCLLALGQF